MLEYIIALGADVNYIYDNPGRYTALLLALQNKNYVMVKSLLAHGADPAIIDDQNLNVFHYIAESFRDIEIVKLFEAYTDELLNEKSRYGYTPLAFLVCFQCDDEYYEGEGVLEMLQYYLDLGADVNLMFEAVKGLDPNFDPISEIIRTEKNEYLKLLFSYADPGRKIPNIPNGMNYLQIALYYARVCSHYVESMNKRR
jgi:ankyrin repeat protein